MSRMRSGTILLILAAPFALYAAWQVQGVVFGARGDTSPPDTAGVPSSDELAALRTQTEQLAADVRNASATALQFRSPSGGETIANQEAAALSAATAKRTSDLIDLQRFLAGTRNPSFSGAMKERYRQWYDETEKLRSADTEIEKWFNEPEPVIAGRASADAELKRFNQQLEVYITGSSLFVDRSRVAGWRVRAVARVITALANTVKAPYDRVLELPLPLPTATRNMDVKIALEGLAELKVQVERIEKLAAEAKEMSIALPANADAAMAAAVKTAQEWAAADELLALFADAELFTDPGKAAKWLPRVEEQFDRMQTDAGKEMIRKKVQQFCAAYIPPAARLDIDVLLQGKREPRSGVTIEYDSDAKSQPLTDLHDKLNEFVFTTRHKGFDRIVWSNGGKFTGVADALQPTALSIAARDYSQARANVAAWSPATVAELKRKCEAGLTGLQLKDRHILLDTLVAVGGDTEWTKANTKLWTRLSALTEAMEKHRALFEAVKD